MRAIVCIGAPGSGKSTYAAEHPECVETNRDNIRLRLFGRVDDHGDEVRVTLAQRDEILNAFTQGRDIIVSDTNLHPKFRGELLEFLQAVGYVTVVRVFDVSLDELCRRNELRDKPVPPYVIDRMYRQLREQFKGGST